MKTTTNIFKTALMLCLSLSFMSLHAQTTHIVNNNAGTDADFTDLQAAIDAAANGDIIHVQQSSTSYGSIDLNKELTLIGRSHSDASYRTELTTVKFLDGCSGSIIKGFRISSMNDSQSGNPSIFYNDIVIQDNYITSNILIGSSRSWNNLLIQGNICGSLTIGNNTSNLLVTNNIFTSSLSFSMVDTLLFANNIINGGAFASSISNNTPDLLNITNCIFVISSFGSDQTVSLSSSSGTFQVSNCLTYNYTSSANYNFATGGNISNSNNQENVDPLFTFRDGSTGSIATNGLFNPTLDDLTLQAGSPFVNAGIYEAYNFKPLGTPTGLPSLKIDSYDPTVPKNSDLTVTITAKTN